MAGRQVYIELAQSLPPRLTRFFARYPTPSILHGTNVTTSASLPALPSVSTASTTSPSDPNADVQETTSIRTEAVNPFRAQRHPISGRWHNPIFSLRRQAELVKLAQKHGVEELLPYTVKGAEAKRKRKEERGLRVKGTGIGQHVKGKGWERTLKPRLEKRRQAMLDMPDLVRSWKERGHGRGWKKWPK